MNSAVKACTVGGTLIVLVALSVVLVSAQAPEEVMSTVPAGRIAFCTDRDGNYDMYMMDANGDNQAPLKSGGGWNWNPDWSPDGTQVAYFMGGGGVADIYVRDLASQTDTRVTWTGNAAEPRWSPDGSRIAFNTLGVGTAEIHVMYLDDNLEVTHLVKLTDNASTDISPKWSPDASRIAFNSDRSGYWDIWVMDVFACPDRGKFLCASEPENLTKDAATEYGFDWSPDGSRLAVASTRGGYKSEIYIFNLGDGSWDDPLTVDGWYDMGPSWSPDGEWIAYSKEVGGGEIYAVNVETGAETPLTDNSWWDSAPDWWMEPVVQATIDLDPDTLNLKSKGNWVTAYIELPEGHDVADVDLATVLLEETIPAPSHPANVGDHDHDGVPDLMVKFSRQDLIAYLKANGLTSGDVELAVTGYVDSVPFEGTDSIRVK